MDKFSLFLTVICLQHVSILTSVNLHGFSQNLVYALIVWRSGLGLLIGRFVQFLTELSAHDTSVFSFRDDNFSKYQWIFTQLGMSIDSVEICLGIANDQIYQSLTELSACSTTVFSFQDNNLSKSHWIFTKLDMCIDIVEIWFGIAYGQNL